VEGVSRDQSVEVVRPQAHGVTREAVEIRVVAENLGGRDPRMLRQCRKGGR
jgi:hypothetical protein